MCAVCCPKKNEAVLSLYSDPSSLVLQNRSPKYWRTTRNTFGPFEKHFSKANEPKKSAEIYFGPKSFGAIFEKPTPAYRLVAPLLGLAKSMYYYYLFIFFLWKYEYLSFRRLTRRSSQQTIGKSLSLIHSRAK